MTGDGSQRRPRRYPNGPVVDPPGDTHLFDEPRKWSVKLRMGCAWGAPEPTQWLRVSDLNKVEAQYGDGSGVLR